MYSFLAKKQAKVKQVLKITTKARDERRAAAAADAEGVIVAVEKDREVGFGKGVRNEF